MSSIKATLFKNWIAIIAITVCVLDSGYKMNIIALFANKTYSYNNEYLYIIYNIIKLFILYIFLYKFYLNTVELKNYIKFKILWL